MGLKIDGVVENMAGLKQRVASPGIKFFSQLGGVEIDVSEKVIELLNREIGGEVLMTCDVFDAGAGGAAKMCSELGVPLLGRIPMDPELGRAAEQGRSILGSMNQSGGKAPPAHCSQALAAIVKILSP